MKQRIDSMTNIHGYPLEDSSEKHCYAIGTGSSLPTDKVFPTGAIFVAASDGTNGQGDKQGIFINTGTMDEPSWKRMYGHALGHSGEALDFPLLAIDTDQNSSGPESETDSSRPIGALWLGDYLYIMSQEHKWRMAVMQPYGKVNMGSGDTLPVSGYQKGAIFVLQGDGAYTNTGTVEAPVWKAVSHA